MGSVAAIPYYGWAMAPEVGAETFAEALSYASAAGGYDIPRGVNPMVQAHESEMILPRTIADPLRAMIAAGGLGGGGGGKANHFHINAIDGKSVERMLTDKRGHIAKALRDHLRSGRFGR
jgi:hypothetical protein